MSNFPKLSFLFIFFSRTGLLSLPPTETGRHFADVIIHRHSHLSPVTNLPLSSFLFPLSLSFLPFSHHHRHDYQRPTARLSSTAKPSGTLSASSPAAAHSSLRPATSPSLLFLSLFLSLSFSVHITTATTASDPWLLPPLTSGKEKKEEGRFLTGGDCERQSAMHW